MYVYTYNIHAHSCIFKEVKPHAENKTQKLKTRKITVPGMINLLVKHSSGLPK